MVMTWLIIVALLMGSVAQDYENVEPPPAWTMPYLNHWKCMQRCGSEYNDDKETNQPLAAKYYYPCTELCICKRQKFVMYP